MGWLVSCPAGGGLAAMWRCLVYYARRDMRATLYYTLLRVLLFFAVAVVLALFGVHGITLLAVALVISAILSLVFLSKLRDRMSASLTRRVDRFHERLDEGTRAEDVD
jgi:peptidoglycan biosynthesis protein MviN/MurJ (putative lipid II flippase)